MNDSSTEATVNDAARAPFVPEVIYHSPRYSGHQFRFRRVNVILGANGCGKSKFLTELKDNASTLTSGGKAVYIEGGRTIKIKDVLQLDHTNVGNYDRYDSAMSTYEGKRSAFLADRVFDALLVLDKRDSHLRAQHSDLVVKWHDEGAKGPCPVRRQPPLERLFELFNEIFPQITLTYIRDSRRLSATKGGETYGPSGLSDGEKQVFSILADLIELDDSHKLIVVDEPELNLHPELAERVWTLVENEFPGKRFVYATHSINFALRETVETVYVLSSDSTRITVFDGLEGLPRAEVTAFLGGLPGILSANRVLVTEGHEKSFDAIFYRWLLDDNKLEIYPGGGCTDVISVAEKRGLWDKISSRISLLGVIDSDYRDDASLKSVESAAVHVLPFHEAESYLCLPEVLSAVAGRIGSQESQLTSQDVEKEIFDELEASKLMVAARRVFFRAKLTLAVSVERKLVSAAPERSKLLSEIRRAAVEEVRKAESLSPDELEKLFDQELNEIDRVLSTRDVSKALRLLPAKNLLNRLAPRAGCRNAADLMRSLRHNFRPDGFSQLSALAAKLRLPA